MHRGRRLSEAVHACPRVRVHGVWYRSVDGAVFLGFYDKKNPKRPLSGLGAPRGGARFTPKNGHHRCTSPRMSTPRTERACR
jgi:hypothetical protein